MTNKFDSTTTPDTIAGRSILLPTAPSGTVAAECGILGVGLEACSGDGQRCGGIEGRRQIGCPGQGSRGRRASRLSRGDQEDPGACPRRLTFGNEIRHYWAKVGTDAV